MLMEWYSLLFVQFYSPISKQLASTDIRNILETYMPQGNLRVNSTPWLELSMKVLQRFGMNVFICSLPRLNWWPESCLKNSETPKDLFHVSFLPSFYSLSLLHHPLVQEGTVLRSTTQASNPFLQRIKQCFLGKPKVLFISTTRQFERGPTEGWTFDSDFDQPFRQRSKYQLISPPKVDTKELIMEIAKKSVEPLIMAFVYKITQVFFLFFSFFLICPQPLSPNKKKRYSRTQQST